MPESAALITFRASLALANELLSLEAAYPDPPPPNSKNQAGGLRGGAAVLMVAAFEAYLNNSISELLRPLLGPPAKPLAQLPTKMQVAAIFDTLEHALYGPRHGNSGTKIARIPDIIAAALRIARGEFDPQAMSQTHSSPGPETIKRLLKSLGIADPFSHMRRTFDRKWANPEAVNFLVDKLEEIVQRRHRVAHAAIVLTISRSDLSLACRFLLTLAETIDEDLQIHIASI